MLPLSVAHVVVLGLGQVPSTVIGVRHATRPPLERHRRRVAIRDQVIDHLLETLGGERHVVAGVVVFDDLLREPSTELALFLVLQEVVEAQGQSLTQAVEQTTRSGHPIGDQHVTTHSSPPSVRG
ncbi:MAG: hypothetical protein UT02_C0008G0005 [Parcubacteria group bacterium GW2011_GWC2_38_7]|nr:MAG: hypothetical protein UT02_C0008G0005 [Parcubacteria group bacterium GW2011_GWC2_38_7]